MIFPPQCSIGNFSAVVFLCKLVVDFMYMGFRGVTWQKLGGKVTLCRVSSRQRKTMLLSIPV